MMRRLTIILAALLLFCASAAADDLVFAWQYDPAVCVDGFRLYLRDGEQYTCLWAGVERQAAVYLPHGTKGEVVVRAFRGHQESPDSVPLRIKLTGKPRGRA